MRLENTPKIVIAAINGHAVGGGLEIAMACDIRIAKKEGGDVGLAEINLGVMPGMGGTQRLPRLVGKARAMELCVTGKTIAFEEALDMGLVHYIYEKDNFMQEVMDYARQFIGAEQEQSRCGQSKARDSNRTRIVVPDGLAFERELLAQTFAQRRRPGRRQSLSRKTHRTIQRTIATVRFPFKRLERFERLESLTILFWRLADG